MILLYDRLTPGMRYVHWRVWQEPYRDCTTIHGIGRISRDDWEVTLDNLAFATAVADTAALLDVAIQYAEGGYAPQEFMRYVHQAVASQRTNQAARQQQLQNQLGGYGSSPFSAPAGLGAQQMSQQQAMGYNQPPQQPTQAPPLPKLWEKPEKIEQEIIAYRAWLMDWECVGWSGEGIAQLPILRPVLHSINQSFTWDGPVSRSTSPPAANSKAGLYAVGADERFAENFRAYVTGGNVWGEVALSGIVVEGENGYRAEVATIRRLWIGGGTRINVYIDSSAKLAQLLADRYQCDVAATPVKPTTEAAHAFYLDAIKQGV